MLEHFECVARTSIDSQADVVDLRICTKVTSRRGSRGKTVWKRMKPMLRVALLLVFGLFGCTTKTGNSVASIQIIPGNNLLSLNATRSFSAFALDANGNALNVKSFTWASSDPSVASVADGQVTANRLGSSQITANANGITSAPVNITVLEAVGTLSGGNASDLMPVLLLGRKLIAGIGLNPAKFAFPSPPLATDLETAPYGSSVTVSGDNADNDGDGLPNDATSSFSGSYQRGTQAALTYSGSVRTLDTSSLSGIADVTADFSNLKLEGTVNAQPYSYTLNGKHVLKNNGTRNNSMTLTSNATLDLTAFGRSSSLEFASSAQFVPDDAANPLSGGTFDWQDTIKTKLAGGTKIVAERGEGVHLGSCGQYDSGRIVILDASTSLNVIEFGPACGAVQLSRNGNSLVPTLAGAIMISPTTAALKFGLTQQFTATALSIAGETIAVPNDNLTWTSSAPNIASIGSNGLVTAQSLTGSTNITAKAFGLTSSPAVLSVSAPNIASITVSPTTASIPVAGTQSFLATALDANNNVIPGQSFTWKSSQPAASITAVGAATGVATGVSIGTSSITASSGGKTSSPATLTVTAAPDFSLTSTPTPLALNVTRTAPAAATAAPFSGSVTAVAGLTGTVTYSLDPLTTPVGVTLTTPITPVVLGPTPVISAMTLNVAASVAANTLSAPNYTFNLIATSSGVPTLKRSVQITLTVTGP
jgi:uncharacterized protein YjdB